MAKASDPKKISIGKGERKYVQVIILKLLQETKVWLKTHWIMGVKHLRTYDNDNEGEEQYSQQKKRGKLERKNAWI